MSPEFKIKIYNGKQLLIPPYRDGAVHKVHIADDGTPTGLSTDCIQYIGVCIQNNKNVEQLGELG